MTDIPYYEGRNHTDEEKQRQRIPIDLSSLMMRKNTRLRLVFPLHFFRVDRFLCALQQNRAQPRLLCLLIPNNENMV